ncbi:hypothetical protein [Cohnella mopanensis]|uniref:hypothetical protein n=1 Tax=Cohnella mopanensis TaxID=2911966 RepID=UPI001EF868B0|nr:hypothetical protein [Cohnella mopanensis]
MVKVILLLLAIWTLTGCNSDDNARSASNMPSTVPVESGYPVDVQTKTAEGLQEIQQKIIDGWREVGDLHSIAILYSGISENEIKLEIRSFGDVERELSERDIDAFKVSLFGLAGEPFPVDISVRACCSAKASVTGKITEVDTQGNRILIVNEHEKNGNSDDPLAFWVSLTEDGKAFEEGQEATDIFDSGLVGKRAQAWTTGLVNQSYPGQVAALKVVVE